MCPQHELRPVDRKRLDTIQKNYGTSPDKDEVWYIHTVLAQCFLPYRNQKDKTHWHKKNGNCSIAITADTVEDENGTPQVLGLPYGAKPRLFLSYVQTQAIKNKSPIIPVKTSMTGMLKELGFKVTGGKEGSINKFKEQINKLAACRFRIISSAHSDVGTGQYLKRHRNADLFREFDVWFPTSPDQGTLWPSTIVLTQEFYENLREHAIPYDFRGLQPIHNNARAQDIYLWLTQRLYRISDKKPLFLKWEHLYEMFGGGIKNPKNFPANFKSALLAAKSAYPDARIEEHNEGMFFYNSPPSVVRTKVPVQNPVK